MYIHAKVHTRASGNKLVKISETKFEIWVKERPVAGVANSQVINLVAQYLSKPVNEVKIISGHTTPTKLLSIKD